MNLYLIERDDNASYDEYISAIVCADSEEEAVKIPVSYTHQMCIRDRYQPLV